MGRIVLEVPDEIMGILDKEKMLELCLRQQKRRFKKFVKATPVKDDGIKEVLETAVEKVFGLENKVEGTVKTVGEKFNILNKNIDSINENIDTLVAKADKILKSSPKALNWANLIVSSLDLGVTVAGFMIMSEELDAMSKELGEISKGVKDLVSHQELLDQANIKALFNEFANVLNMETVGEEVSVNDYYNLVNRMSLTLDTLRECFIKDIGNRRIYLEGITRLLGLYKESIIKFDRAHVFAYGKTHANRASYIKTLESFVDKDFFVGLQEHCFLNEDAIKDSRMAYEYSFGYIVKILDSLSDIDTQLKVVNVFNNKQLYDEFQRRSKEKIKDEIIQSITDEDNGTANELKMILATI